MSIESIIFSGNPSNSTVSNNLSFIYTISNTSIFIISYNTSKIITILSCCLYLCSFEGSISVSNDAGDIAGIVGRQEDGGTVNHCKNKAQIKATTQDCNYHH